MHCVFAVQNRLDLINIKWQDKLYKYMSGIKDQQGHKLNVINGMSVNSLRETRPKVT
ncbi:MAG: transposase [Bacteroidales bacterium]|nr:transposase [Bacteroidales bacterium]